MTGLRRWRKVAGSLTIASLAWEAAVTIASLVLLILVAARGGTPPPDRLMSVVGTLGICGVAIWAIRDARRRRRAASPRA